MLSIYGYGIDGFIEYFKAALCSMVQCLIWVSFDERNKVNGKTVKMTETKKDAFNMVLFSCSVVSRPSKLFIFYF